MKYRSELIEDFQTSGKYFANVPLIDVDMERLIDLIRTHRADSGDFLVTPNIDHLRLIDDSQNGLAEAYKEAAFVICDSRIIRALSRIIPGKKILNVNPGSDLTSALFDQAWFQSSRIAIIGSTKGSVDSLQQRYRLLSVHHHNPPMGYIQDAVAVEKCISFIKEVQPDYLLIATGCPQSEILASVIKARLRKTESKLRLALCIGASIDFLTGKQKRAPAAFRALGMEWLHRLVFNFSRLNKRYSLDLLWILKFLAKSWFPK